MDPKNYQQVPYNPSSAYPHPQPPPAYDATGLYPSISQVPVPPPYEQTAPLPSHQPSAAIVHTIVQHGPLVGPEPTSVTCPSCRQAVITNLDYESSTKTHLMALLLCAFCWPCMWLPYVMDSCKNANHYCPNCGAFIGSYKS